MFSFLLLDCFFLFSADEFLENLYNCLLQMIYTLLGSRLLSRKVSPFYKRHHCSGGIQI
jgi:hypothetical protein